MPRRKIEDGRWKKKENFSLSVDVCLSGVKGISVEWARRIVEAVLKAERVSGRCVAVKVTGDREIRRINKKFLNHDYATDVISFGMDEPGYLGDLVVSADTARRYARENGLSYKEELARYLVHGTLHLLGYDDKKKKDFERMHKRQESLLRKIL